MEISLGEGARIYVERKKLGVHYSMPTMQMTKDYYTLGYIISGDLKTITPTESYYCGAGTVGFTLPYIYHRTMTTSSVAYERILITFTPDFVKPFIEKMGQQIFDQLYEQKSCCFSEENTKRIEEMFVRMAEEYEEQKPFADIFLQGMLFRLLLMIYETKLTDTRTVHNRTPLTPPIMDAIVFIENNYVDNPTLEEAAKVAGFSTAYFSRQFSAQLGKSYTEYLDNIKIQHVQRLLTRTKKSIMEIAEETGYCHGNYLNSQFKKKVGMTPGQFRKQNKEV